jgi:hypothetical protein
MESNHTLPSRTLRRALPGVLALAAFACSRDGGAPLADVLVHDVAGGASTTTVRAPRPRSEAPTLGTLRLARQFGDSLSFARISSLTVVGDYLLATDRMMSLHLAVVDLGSGQLLRQFGRHGQGPREFQDPSWASVASARPARAWVYDFQNRRYTLLRLGGAGGGEVLREMPLDLGVSVESPMWTRSGIIASGIFPDFTLLALDSAGRARARLVADPPYTARDIAHWNGRRRLNRTHLAAHPSGERLALAYQYRSRIDLFTADGGRYAAATGPRETTPRWRVDGDRFFWEDDNELAYVDAHGTERYVYALFCGCREGALPTRVHVFRWNGEFVGELAVDRPMLAFTVSPDDSHLYGAFEEPFSGIGEWPLPELLRRGGGGSRPGPDGPAS